VNYAKTDDESTVRICSASLDRPGGRRTVEHASGLSPLPHPRPIVLRRHGADAARGDVLNAPASQATDTHEDLSDLTFGCSSSSVARQNARTAPTDGSWWAAATVCRQVAIRYSRSMGKVGGSRDWPTRRTRPVALACHPAGVAWSTADVRGRPAHPPSVAGVQGGLSVHGWRGTEGGEGPGRKK